MVGICKQNIQLFGIRLNEVLSACAAPLRSQGRVLRGDGREVLNADAILISNIYGVR